MNKGHNKSSKFNTTCTCNAELDIIYEQSLQDDLTKTEAFKKDIAYVINKHSMECHSNTPDYVLADFLYRALIAFHKGTNNRTEFYNVEFPLGEEFDILENPNNE